MDLEHSLNAVWRPREDKPKLSIGLCSLYYCHQCGQLQKHTDLTVIEVEIMWPYIQGLTTDYEGNAIPQGGAPDIGAYEYNSSGAWLGF